VKELRFVVASCVVYKSKESYSTTVTLSIEVTSNVLDINKLVREEASAQMDYLYRFTPDPLKVIVLNIEDITFEPNPAGN
jgi:hypothetical protein